MFKYKRIEKKLYSQMNEVRAQLDIIKCRIDVPNKLAESFMAQRNQPEYQTVYAKQNPLVTVCVGTYNRSELLIERSIKSLLAQTYKNLQIVVVGDCCTDDTEAAVAKINDDRVVFENLSERGRYPEQPEWRWMVAGTATVNRALELSEGDFITHLDDDDEHMPERVEKLLQCIQGNKMDLVWHPFYYWKSDKKGWRENKSEEFKLGKVTTSSVLYHKWFKNIPWDIDAYRLREPGDWNRFRKFHYLGAKMMRYQDVLLRHHPERAQKG